MDLRSIKALGVGKHKPMPKAKLKVGGSRAFKCPKCDGKTVVTDSRPHGIGNIKRRRCCVVCDYRFGTYELLADELSPHVDFVLKETATALRQLASKLDGADDA